MTGKQRHPGRLLSLGIVVLMCAWLVAAQSQSATPSRDISVEVFAVLDLPISVQEAKLVKTEKGYLLRFQLANSSETKMIGLRYSLVVEQPDETSRQIFNRSEGFALKPYATRRITFPTPFKISPKDGQRAVLMLEQAISTDSIWEVVKAKEALSAYLQGDYSVVPTVVRTANQVDAPLPARVIYQD